MIDEKGKAIRRVIEQRVAAIDRILKREDLTKEDRAYYEGKREGLMQGHSLAGSMLQSISVELEGR